MYSSDVGNKRRRRKSEAMTGHGIDHMLPFCPTLIGSEPRQSEHTTSPQHQLESKLSTDSPNCSIKSTIRRRLLWIASAKLLRCPPPPSSHPPSSPRISQISVRNAQTQSNEGQIGSILILWMVILYQISLLELQLSRRSEVMLTSRLRSMGREPLIAI
jgi:hypothetical protein